LANIAQAAAVIGGYGNFGVPTDLFCSPQAAADLDVNLDPAYRVPLNSGQPATMGTPVRGIVTAQGDIAIQRDVFIQDEMQQQPFEVLYPTIAAGIAATPVSVVPAAPAPAVEAIRGLPGGRGGGWCLQRPAASIERERIWARARALDALEIGVCTDVRHGRQKFGQ
jgi:hypothetical protein